MRRRTHAGAERHGRAAETLSIIYLKLKGYRILDRDWRSVAGEIDIVACRGRVVAIIEVKARDSLASAAEAVTPGQRRRIERAALHYLARRPDLAGFDIRFDVMLVIPWRRPRHLADSWRPEA